MLKQIVEYIKEEEFKLTIYRDRVHIMNYQELLSLENNMIRIKGTDQRYYVKGKDLIVNRLLNKEILIVGKFLEVEIKYDEE